MTDKSSLQSFQSDWAKTQAWAQSQKISPNAYLPVYQMDARRLLQYGQPMSQSERTRAILASSGMSAVTQLPQDNPNPTAIYSNTVTNLQQIFTGLEPTNLAKSIWDTVTNTIDHPATLFAPVSDFARVTASLVTDNPTANKNALADLANSVLSQHSIWQFVPGAIDIAHLAQGQKGLDYLATSPVTSLLDVLPLDRVPMKVLAKTEVGAALADHLGIHPDELATMGSGQVAWKLLKNRPTSMTGLVHLPDGSATVRPLNVGERINVFRNLKGAGVEQGELLKAKTVAEERGTDRVIELVKPALVALDKLSEASRQTVIQVIQDDHRPDEAILHDPNFSTDEKQALEKVFDWTTWNRQLKMQAGQMEPITSPVGINPDGTYNYATELYLIRPGSSGERVLRAQQAANAANDALSSASRTFDQLAIHTQDIDSMLSAHIQQISALRSNIYESIKASIPDIPKAAVTDVLRETLPESEKWDRSVLKSANLEAYFGLDEKTQLMVSRPKGNALPFSGMFNTWTDAEREAWQGARQALGDDATRSSIKDQATKRLQLLGAAKPIKVHAPVSMSAARVLKELVGPGGMVDQMAKAYDDQDWEGLRKLSEVADRKLKNKSFISPNQAPPLTELRQMVAGLKQFSRHRAKVMDELNRRWYGTNKAGIRVQTGSLSYKSSLEYLTKEVNKYNDRFLHTAIHNPPDVWRTALLEEYTKQVLESEHGAQVVDQAYAALHNQGWNDDELTKLRSDPRAIMEMITLSSKASYETEMLPNLDIAESNAIKRSAYNEIAQLRAQGLSPRYMPTVSPFDVREGDAQFNISIGVDHLPTVDSAFSRAFDHTSSVYNLQAAMLKETRQQVSKDETITFLNDHMAPLTYDRAELEPILRNYFLKEHLETVTGATREGNISAFYDQKLAELGLRAYDPQALFGVSLPRFAGKTTYMDGALLDGITKAMARQDNAILTGFDKVTGVFRTSILGYSPRFTAHIFFGGGFLLALRSPADFLKFIPDAWKMVRSGQLPEDVANKYAIRTGDLHGVLQKSSTQEGIEDIKWQHATSLFHGASSYSAAQFAIDENVAKYIAQTGADKLHAWLRVVPDMNYRFTRWTTNMQRSVAFLEGVEKANKSGHFYMDEVDDTGKVIRAKKEMTGDEALNEGMKHVEKVMGDLRAMSPIERNTLVRIMPFWGWTKHILKYVMSYPMDHPYRAMFLSQLATQNSQDVASGLPLRIQLLFFLGSPDAQGNVNAVDIRALNPLRDTANYASLSGWLAALNPVLTAPISAVDPSITFGNNVMYPNITYNSLYGTSEAQPAGNEWNAAESVVPELSSIDAAFNLSGQYAYLRQAGESNAFLKKLYESLNIPFLQEQSINLRQISATDELDRYQQAKAAANTAWTSGDFSGLSGYGLVPDPRNTQYDISPSQLQNIYNTIQAQNPGLSPASIAPELPNPAY